MLRKKALAAALSVSLLSAFSGQIQAQESAIAGSAGLSTAYLLRGLDLDSPQFWGQADYAVGGFSTSLWISSLASAGYELNFVPSYNFALSDTISIDVGAVVYKYEDTDFGDYVDLTAGIGFGDFYLGYMHTVGSEYEDIDWDYLTLSGGFGDFSALVGYDMWDDGLDDGSYVHLDLSYAVTEELSFTVSKILTTDGSYGDNIAATYSDDVQFLVGYSLPIGN